MKKPERLKLTGKIKSAAQILKKGGVVIFPTDTVYGIGCRYDDRKAVARIRRIKGTPKSQQFPVLVSNVGQLEKLARVNQVARELIKKYWPGGLTIILENFSGQKMGFRMPDAPLARLLISKIGVPIVGTSANFHGQKAAKSFEELDPEFVKLADLVISGNCKGGVESTVVDATGDGPKILRQGAVELRAMILKIDATNSQEVIVELVDTRSGKGDKMVEKQKFGSQVLLPMIVKILRKNKADFSDLTSIEVNPGPGSFTGTRVGVTVANTLGFVLGLSVNGKRNNIVTPIYEKSKFD